MNGLNPSLFLLMEQSANKAEEERNLRERVEAIFWLYASGLTTGREHVLRLMALKEEEKSRVCGNRRKTIEAAIDEYSEYFTRQFP